MTQLLPYAVLPSHKGTGHCPNKKAIEVQSGMAGNKWLACVSGSCKLNRTVPNIFFPFHCPETWNMLKTLNIAVE
jgi:hypothetical protein